MVDAASDSVEDFRDFLLEKGIPSSCISIFSGKCTFGGGYYFYLTATFLENHVDAESFLELTENEIKQLIKPLGVVKKLVILQKKVPSFLGERIPLYYVY